MSLGTRKKLENKVVSTRDPNLLRNNIWKWLVLGILAAFSFYVANPLFDKKDAEGNVVAQGKMRLGLDLKGGTSFTLGVDKDKLAEILIAEDSSLTNTPGLLEEKIASTLKDADSRIIEVVRRRVDGMGVNEPVIQGGKDHRLTVQLPGIEQEKRLAARQSIQSAAFLEFRLVHPRNNEYVTRLLATDACPEGYVKSDTGSGYRKAPNYAEVSGTRGYQARFSAFRVPDPHYAFMLDNEGRPYFVSRKAELTGDSLTSARVERDPVTSKLSIGFQLDGKGASTFATLTRNYKAHGPRNPSNVGRQLAIILDGSLYSAPVINDEIPSGRGEITGHFTPAEAQQLANVLNAGALPAPLKILAESTVAPTVGADAINKGLWAAGLGFALVALFMVFYYWYCGLAADVALALDFLLLPSALVIAANVLGVFARDASMGGGGSTVLPVLTLPGIAGLVLTLGMAVDANVLIYERIREEFKANVTAGTAIKNGYARAFTAIFDSNITTIITGAILFTFGSGPVRGFAITLTAGVIISMFTALVVTRLMLDHTVNPDSVKPFRMLQAFKQPNFDFVGKGKFTVAVSGAIILVSLAIFAIRLVNKPASVLAVDLTGGTAITFSFNQDAKPAEGDIRKALDAFDNGAVVQYQKSIDGKNDTVLVKTSYTADNVTEEVVPSKDVPAKVQSLLDAALPDAKFAQVGVDEVGSVVGEDLKTSGTKAVCFSLVAILVYVAFRFRFGFGLGALVALAHDALISLGLFSLCGRQVSLIVITALLTIIGYSVNDTVVIFDRIREDMHREGRLTFKEVANASVNRTLSRTFITSITTFFAVLALFAFGDGTVYDFALTMLFGVIAGTYSSIFIATPVMLWWYRGKRPDLEDESKEENK